MHAKAATPSASLGSGQSRFAECRGCSHPCETCQPGFLGGTADTTTRSGLRRLLDMLHNPSVHLRMAAKGPEHFLQLLHGGKHWLLLLKVLFPRGRIFPNTNSVDRSRSSTAHQIRNCLQRVRVAHLPLLHDKLGREGAVLTGNQIMCARTISPCLAIT